MKKLISMFIVICLVSAMMPVAFAETVTDTIYSEDFESGNFTVETNEAGTVKEIKKDGETVFTYATTNGKAFSSFPENPVAAVAVTNAPVNNSVALTTESYAMSSAYGYINFEEKITDGIVTIDYRMQRPDSGSKNIYMYATEDAVAPATYEGDYAAKIYTRTASSSKPNVAFLNYHDAENSTMVEFDSSTTRNNAKGYNYYKLIIDLETNKVSFYLKSANSGDDDVYADYRVIEEDVEMYKNVDGSFADGISGLYFTGSSYLRLDDIVITHTYDGEADVEDPKAEVEGLTINADGTVSSSATFNYLDTDSAPKTARLVTAVYNNDGALIAIKSSANATVDADNTSAQLITEAITIPVDAETVKAFVWDFSTLKPYAVTEIPVN